MTTPAVADWTTKRGDRLPRIRAQLTRRSANGTSKAVDLTNALSVQFIMVGVGGVTKTVTGAAIIVTGVQEDGTTLTKADGWVEYAWGATDTTTVGSYEGEWEVLWPGNLPESFPKETVHTIRVVPDRGGVA